MRKKQKNVSENSVEDPPRPQSTYQIPSHATRVFKGEIFDVYQWEQQMFDGTTAIFEKLKRDDSVGIIAATTDGKILLIDEEQPGRKQFLSIPGGCIDKGEGVLEAAARELREETGYVAEEFVLIESVQPTSKVDWAVYQFIAKRCKKVGEMTPDVGEKIKLRPVSFEEFVELAINKTISEWQLSERMLRAKLFPEEMKKLRQLLFE